MTLNRTKLMKKTPQKSWPQWHTRVTDMKSCSTAFKNFFKKESVQSFGDERLGSIAVLIKRPLITWPAFRELPRQGRHSQLGDQHPKIPTRLFLVELGLASKNHFRYSFAFNRWVLNRLQWVTSWHFCWKIHRSPQKWHPVHHSRSLIQHFIYSVCCPKPHGPGRGSPCIAPLGWEMNALSGNWTDKWQEWAKRGLAFNALWAASFKPYRWSHVVSYIVRTVIPSAAPVAILLN